jgi:hypothetical protein
MSFGKQIKEDRNNGGLLFRTFIAGSENKNQEVWFPIVDKDGKSVTNDLYQRVRYSVGVFLDYEKRRAILGSSCSNDFSKLSSPLGLLR